MTQIRTLVDRYLKYIHNEFEICDIQDGVYEIVTPFLDRKNDHISIYADLRDDTIRLTDDGQTIADLSMSGIDVKSGTRREKLRNILYGYGVTLNGEAIETAADEKNFPYKQHGLIQAILSANDLYLTARRTVYTLFTEEIGDFFDKKDIPYIQNSGIEGVSGFQHKFDFVIAKNYTSSKREALIKALNTPKKENIETTIFAFEDTGNRDAARFVILNDREQKIKDSITGALEKYDIMPLLWSNPEQAYQTISAA